jgi:hypothetical protein
MASMQDALCFTLGPPPETELRPPGGRCHPGGAASGVASCQRSTPTGLRICPEPEGLNEVEPEGQAPSNAHMRLAAP